jgi:hypothetical protein
MKKLLKYFMMIIIAISFCINSCFAQLAKADSAAAFWESLPQEKKETTSPQLLQKELASKPSPTENYLKEIGWDTVRNITGISDTEFFDMSMLVRDKIIPAEKLHADNYYVLYHGTQVWLWVLFELQRDLFELIAGWRPHHTFLRIPGEYHALQESADKFLKRNNNIIFDSLADMQRILLATNYTFPGNLQFGESTFLYFLASESVHPPLMNLLFHKIVESLFAGIRLTNRNKKQIDQMANSLVKIAKDLTYEKKRKYGLLLQIFIPKERAGELVFLAEPGGSPVTESGFTQKRLAKFMFEKLRTSPEDVQQFLEELQARILLKADSFSLPGHVKIFEYLFMPEKELRKYEARIAKVAKNIFSLRIAKSIEALVSFVDKGRKVIQRRKKYVK